MKQQHTLQPKLRFPDFEGGWNSIKLENIASKIGSGKTPLGGDKVYQTEGIPFIRSQNVNSDQLILDDTFIPIEVHKSMNSSKVIANDILLNITGASIGRSCVVPNDFIEGNVNQHVCIVRIKNEKPIFIQKIISSNIGQKLIYETQTGSGREGLNFESIKKFKINIPSLPEQQKIADYLATIDNKINLLEEKKAQLALYKKAMMQKLFTQEIRFKPSEAEALEAYPEWEEKHLGEVFSGLKGQGLSKDSLLDEGENNCILYGELFTKYKEVIKSVISKTNTFSGVKSKSGDILIPASTTTKAFDLANATALLLDNIILGGDINILRPKQKLSSEFYAYYLSNYKKHELGKLGQGITIVHLYYTHFKNIMIDLPSLPEQQKIADFLSAIDESIEKVTEQISQTQSFKKAMLQQLFV